MEKLLDFYFVRNKKGKILVCVFVSDKMSGSEIIHLNVGGR
jgi:hypothetical protein